MSLNPNYNAIFKKFSYKNFQLTKICGFLNENTKILIYKQTVLPMVEYASFLLYLNRNLDLDKLQRLQNRALRICFGIYDPKSISIDDLHKRAKMRKLAERCDLHLLNIMYDSQKYANYIRKAAVCTRQADKVCFHTEQVHYMTFINGRLTILELVSGANCPWRLNHWVLKFCSKLKQNYL